MALISNNKNQVANNALDVSPTWEDATAEFLTMDYYEFDNTKKQQQNSLLVSVQRSMQMMHLLKLR